MRWSRPWMAALLGAVTLVTGCGKPAAPKGPAPAAGAATEAAAPTPAAPAIPAGSMVSYANPVKGFAIQFPTEWQRVEHYFGTAIAAIGPAPAAGATMPTANVVIETLPEGTTLDVYVAQSRRNLGASIQAYRELEQGSTTLDGQPAKWLVSTYQTNQRPVQALATFLVAGGKAYVITCAADPQQFKTLRPKFEAVAASFHLLGVAPAAADPQAK